MKDFIYQVDSKECGYACVKMLLAQINKNENFLYLPRFNGTDEAYSLFDLIAFTKKYGVILTGYQIKGFNALNNERAPFIYIKTLANNSKHALLIKKKWRYFAYVYDPANGKKISLIKKEFSDCVYGVEILSVEASQTASLNVVVPKLISKRDQYTIVLLNIGALITFFFAAYFVNENADMLMPIVFIVIGVILAIIHRVYMYKTMQKFDEEFIAITFDSDTMVRESNYRLMHKVKAGLFTSYSRFLVSLFTALAINLVLILKDRRSFIILIASLLAALIDNFFISSIIKKRSEEIFQLEQHLLSNDKKSEEEYLNEYAQIKENTYSIARNIDYKRIIIYFVLLVIVLIMSWISKQNNIYFILFYLMTAIFSYDNFAQAFKINDESKENIINQTKFIHLLLKKQQK